jgi:hypothetical protein
MTLSLAGAWYRRWEEDPLGDAQGADRTTFVQWTQASKSGVYVDLRLPNVLQSKRPRRPSALAANGSILDSDERLGNDELSFLLRQKSFAGILQVTFGDATKGAALNSDTILAELAASKDPSVIPLCTCVWRRNIDFQPPTGNLDVGVCVSEPRRDDGSTFLRETGQDASYAEGWLRSANTEKGPFCALELLSENGMTGARKGFWVRAGNRFAYAIGRPTTKEAAIALNCAENSHMLQHCIGKSIEEAVKELTTDTVEMMRLIGSYVAVTGEVGPTGSWIIQHSTSPDLVGCLLFGEESDTICCSVLQGSWMVGCEIEQRVLTRSNMPPVTRVWKVVEMS